jgi:hypothetical protein
LAFLFSEVAMSAVTQDRGLRRRLVALGLGLTPGDLRQAARVGR